MSAKICKSICDSDKHEADVTSILFYKNYIFSGGADGKIKIWTEDLSLLKCIEADNSYIYAMAITSNGKLYSSRCDGTIKFMEDPINSDEVKELLRCSDDIESLFCVNNTLYSGDDKGVVTMWENDRITFKFNLIEEVKSLAVEKNTIYTVRDLDAIVSEIMPGKSGKYSTKATIPGKSPLALIGPDVDGYHKYLVFSTRDGKGVTLVNNLPGNKFATLWTLENCHEMIINTICGDSKSIFTAGYDGKVKKWINIETSPIIAGEVDIGNCVNQICSNSNGIIFCGSSDGIVRKIEF